jgi:hypothetical protein
MKQSNYISRILELIQLNKNDIEIKRIIYKEYDIPLTEKSINTRRNYKNNSITKKKSVHIIDKNIDLLKSIIEKDSIPKTFNDICALFLQDYNVKIEINEVRKILWNDLKKEIIYNDKEFTYALKSSYAEKDNPLKTSLKNQLQSTNLSPRIIFSINDLVLEKISNFKTSYCNSNPTYQISGNNAIVEKLLISSLSQINIDKQLSTEEENKYILYGAISSKNFLNELKLILQCFIKKQIKLNEVEINNYLTIVCKLESKTIDLKKLLGSDLSFIFNRESIYYTTIKSTALNDLHLEVTNELFFYNLFVNALSKNESQGTLDKEQDESPIDASFFKTGIIEIPKTIDSSIISLNTKKINKKEVTEIVYESKISAQNNIFLYPEEQENNACKTISELLPLSLFYSHIPLKKEFRLNISNVAKRLELANSDLYDLRQIKKSILLIQNHLEDESDWELVYHNFKKGIEEQDVKLNINGELLKRYAKNPFNYFLLLVESTIENISFDENIRFQKLLKEVCRDNVVTEAERELVFEKASYFGINHDKVELYLANEFRNYPSFIVLINEICEDGIVTEKEREFIEEKARIYKIPPDSLDKLISIGLFKVKRLKDLKQNIDFQEIIAMYLISSVLDLDLNFTLNINQFISGLNESEIFKNQIEHLHAFKVTTFKKLCELLNDKLEFNIFNLVEFKNIEILLLKLGLKNVVFNFQETENNINKPSNISSWKIVADTNLNKNILINFSNRTLTYKNKHNKSESDLFKDFMQNVSMQRNFMRCPELDLFFENLQEFYED